MCSQRVIGKISTGIYTSDGSGVKLRRLIGNDELIGISNTDLSPFLLMDEIKSENQNDYIRGFDSHAHRGQQTISYMINGSLKHEDNKGNKGILKPGAVQFMNAGKGIIHSEMPIKENLNYYDDGGGVAGGIPFHAFQIWINLKQVDKMSTPSYQDIQADKIPIETNNKEGYKVKVIAGKFGDITGPVVGVKLNPLFLDIELKPNTKLNSNTLKIPSVHNSFIYVFKGNARFGPGSLSKLVKVNQIGCFLNNGSGDENSYDTVQVESGSDGVRFLLLAALPIYNEKVVQYGPFVMNTQQEIEKAILDLRMNNF